MSNIYNTLFDLIFPLKSITYKKMKKYQKKSKIFSISAVFIIDLLFSSPDSHSQIPVNTYISILYKDHHFFVRF